MQLSSRTYFTVVLAAINPVGLGLLLKRTMAPRTRQTPYKRDAYLQHIYSDGDDGAARREAVPTRDMFVSGDGVLLPYRGR